METIAEQWAAFRDDLSRLKREIGKAFVGQPEIVEQLLIGLLCQGHILLEGLPGLGKTLLVKTLGEVLGLSFARIQCTPDLMPADIIGTNILVDNPGGQEPFRFQKGPLFANIVLADEINRATPKTQSAFLEAMQERRVTVFGATYKLAEPFLLLATQNPIEMEGTYTLPEAQLDRFFFKLTMHFPTLEELSTIMDLTTTDQVPEPQMVCDQECIRHMMALVKRVKIAEDVKRYALRLMLATHPDYPEATDAVRQFVRYGASPRAAQSMILSGKVKALQDGRYNVAFDDLQAVAIPALRHRIVLSFEAEVAHMRAEDIVTDLLTRLRP